jgi:hypothetical protein
MPTGNEGFSRRSFLKRAGAVSLGTIAARGVYDMLDEIGVAPARAAAAGATVRRRQEQYLVDSVEVILDNGVTCAVPPIHNDVITAKLASGLSTTSALKNAQSRLENALATVERPYAATGRGTNHGDRLGASVFPHVCSVSCVHETAGGRRFFEAVWHHAIRRPGCDPVSQ